MKTRFLLAAGAALLFSAGAALAAPAAASGDASQPAVTHTASTAAPASSQAPSSGNASASGGAVSCRTNHGVGQACGCKSAPGRRGRAQAGTNGGHTMCVIPARHA
jgi:hypothetical protein